MDVLGGSVVTILAPSDSLQIVTASAVSTIDVQASYVDMAGGSYTPGSAEAAISTAATTTVVSAPGGSTYRKIKALTVANTSATSCQVTVQHFNGTIAADLMGVTLQAGESLVRSDNGNFRHFTAAGAEFAFSAAQRPALGVSGAKAETIPRILCTETSSAILTSGTLRLDAIWLAAGTVVNSISYFSGTTAAGTPTNQIFALYGRRWNLLAQTNNDTTTAWAANSIKTLNLTTPYTIPVSDLYYLGILVTATTVPSLKTQGLATTISQLPPSLKGNSNTGLTTTLPDPCAAIPAGSTNASWACVS